MNSKFFGTVVSLLLPKIFGQFKNFEESKKMTLRLS